ncbi:MAG: response regulator transcription factor [Anaerolineae bacterium]
MRILIADDQPKVRFALRVTLERQPGFKAVSEAVDAEDLISQAQAMCPDLVLLDWELPGMAAEELLCNLHRSCPQLSVIALSGKEDAREAALKAGVNAFVSKADPPDRLLSAIGEYWNREQDKAIRNSRRLRDGAGDLKKVQR